MLNTISNLLYLTFCYHSIYDDSYDYDDWREWLLIGIGVSKYRYQSIPIDTNRYQKPNIGSDTIPIRLSVDHYIKVHLSYVYKYTKGFSLIEIETFL